MNLKFKTQHFYIVRLFFLFGLMLTACSKTSFTPVSSEIPNSGTNTPIDNPAYQAKETSFEIVRKKQAVDILFVIDNSDSMLEEQQKISQEFSRFTSQISNVDWRIAITTTDNDTTAEGSKGAFLNFNKVGKKLYFVDAQTPNVNALFTQTINTGISGSATETGFYSVRDFIKNANNAKKIESTFLRKNADFHTIVVSDSDQAQDEENIYDPKVLLKSILVKIKNKYVNHSFVDDGSRKCDSEVKGSSYMTLSQLTGGTVNSICKPNYADNFKVIADQINNEITVKTLDCNPADLNQDGKPEVIVVSPSGQRINEFRIDGSKITFTKPLVENGSYDIQYQCLK